MTNNQTRDVLWSGGLDSTALIYHYLRANMAVRAYYVRIDGNPWVNNELAAIAAIRPYLSEFQFEYGGELLSINISGLAHYDSVIFHQLPVWLAASVWLRGPVGIGYAMGDQAISYLNDIHKIARAYSGIRQHPLKIETPLIKQHKRELFNSLPNVVKKLIWWCETDELTPCRQCQSCKRMFLDVGEDAWELRHLLSARDINDQPDTTITDLASRAP